MYETFSMIKAIMRNCFDIARPTGTQHKNFYEFLI